MFRVFNATKSEARKFTKVFVDDRVKYCFDLSSIMALFLGKEVFFTF